MLLHASRQPLPWLIFNVRQKTMWFGRLQPTKKPTPAEYKVLAAVFSIACAFAGVGFLYFGFKVHAKSPADAASLLRAGAALLAAGFLVPILGGVIVRWLSD
ncbi:MAG TPA: hypothetical protein VHC20_06810 [Candidatus Paceibacterota bacterium]|nr:hypothetical protein [Candidatus Paceibacterota bacterium]